jgi:cytochrome b involved in lipid metabolism
MEIKEPEKCIITINGKKYDVTEWRYKHPGGDVFTNGTDMTEAFLMQHGKDLSRLKPFEVKEDLLDLQIDLAKADATIKPKVVEATQIIDRTDDATDAPKPYSMADIDKALKEELDEI